MTALWGWVSLLAAIGLACIGGATKAKGRRTTIVLVAAGVLIMVGTVALAIIGTVDGDQPIPQVTTSPTASAGLPVPVPSTVDSPSAGSPTVSATGAGKPPTPGPAATTSQASNPYEPSQQRLAYTNSLTTPGEWQPLTPEGTCHIGTDGLHVFAYQQTNNCLAPFQGVDFTMEVEFSWSSGRAGGFFVRNADGSPTFYWARLGKSGYATIAKRLDGTGKSQTLDQHPQDPSRTAYTIALVVTGTRMSLYLDHHLVATAYDGSYQGARAGLLTDNLAPATGGETVYRNLRIWTA